MPIGDRYDTSYDGFTWPGDNTGLEYYDLSIPWGHGVANWPYFEDPSSSGSTTWPSRGS